MHSYAQVYQSSLSVKTYSSPPINLNGGYMRHHPSVRTASHPQNPPGMGQKKGGGGAGLLGVSYQSYQRDQNIIALSGHSSGFVRGSITIMVGFHPFV